MKKNKVIVLGLQKTGTTTLETVLNQFGYRVYGGDKNLLKFNKRDEVLNYIEEIFEKNDAVQDMPWPIYYKELYELYPNAKFILTYRDPDSWIKSVVKYFASIRIPLHQKIYNTPCAEGYEKEYLEYYNNLNNEIINFFNNKDNFKVLTVPGDFNYKTFCDFIGIKNIPNEDFPRSRKNSQYMSKFKLYRNVRSFYINKKKGY
jgi:hypothetical protein